jgi:hypothetical protein
MAHLWVEAWSDGLLEWVIRPLRSGVCQLSAKGPQLPDCTSGSGVGPAHCAALIRHAGENQEEWILLAPSAIKVTVNGALLPHGAHVLRDRDCIFLANGCDRQRCFFSTERLAQIEPFPGTGPEVRCPRCKQPMETGTPSVRCPSCGVYHHQSANLTCWSYGPKCALCDQPTDLNLGRYRWTPDEL